MREDRASRAWVTAAVTAVVVAALLGLAGGMARAAELKSGDAYTLPAGQTVQGNLYVSAGEITVDGTVNGDLVALGGYIEINGEVTGDVLAMGGGITVNGKVDGDVRAAGGGITVNGQVGGDFVAAGGGSMFPGGPAFPITVGGRQIEQGVRVTKEAAIGGDVLVVGGSGSMAGAVAGNLHMAMGSAQLAGRVNGSASLEASQVNVASGAHVGGTLAYTADSLAEVPPSAAGKVVKMERAPQQVQQPSLSQQLITWFIGIGRALVGFVVIGWLVLTFVPRLVEQSAARIERDAGVVVMIGIVALIVAVPLTIALTLFAWLFWGGFPGATAVGLFMLGLWSVLWVMSPLITGYWLGRKLLGPARNRLVTLFVGAAAILLLSQLLEWIPVIGSLLAWLVLLVSFILATGSLLRRPPLGAPTTMAPPL